MVVQSNYHRERERERERESGELETAGSELAIHARTIHRHHDLYPGAV